MSERDASCSPGMVAAIDKEVTGSFSVADLLGLASMPTFAVMAATTGFVEGGSMSVLCMGGHGSMLSGMAPMYALMGLFHLPAWLRLMSGQRQIGRSVAGRSSVPHTKLESTVRYLGIEVDDALAISEQVEL